MFDSFLGRSGFARGFAMDSVSFNPRLALLPLLVASADSLGLCAEMNEVEVELSASRPSVSTGLESESAFRNRHSSCL